MDGKMSLKHGTPTRWPVGQSSSSIMGGVWYQIVLRERKVLAPIQQRHARNSPFHPPRPAGTQGSSIGDFCWLRVRSTPA